MNDDYTYYWQFLSITKRSVKNKASVIHKIIFKLVGRSPENVEGEFKTAFGLAIPEEFNENFIEYENLTEEIIVSWIEQFYDMNEIYKHIHNEIEKNKNPEEIVVNGYYPWQQIQYPELTPPTE